MRGEVTGKVRGGGRCRRPRTWRSIFSCGSPFAFGVDAFVAAAERRLGVPGLLLMRLVAFARDAIVWVGDALRHGTRLGGEGRIRSARNPQGSSTFTRDFDGLDSAVKTGSILDMEPERDGAASPQLGQPSASVLPQPGTHEVPPA